MKTNYEKGGYGYGHAKQALYELIVEKFATPRERYHYYMNHLEEVDNALAIGAKKATKIANETLSRVRSKVGY
jgi:tryptophanyl-tRNA synthetase